MDVYVLVLVSYDYYRFQDNMGVFRTIDAAIAQAKFLNSKVEILCYDENEEKNMDNKEKTHWCIQHYYCA